MQVLEPDAGLQSTLRASLALRDFAAAAAAGVFHFRPEHRMHTACLLHMAHACLLHMAHKAFHDMLCAAE